MKQLRNIQWWTGTLLVTLMGSIVLFAYVARRPLCIDSKIVERIDSISKKGTATAYRCALHRHVQYDEALAQQKTELSRRLQKLGRFFDLVGPLNSKINLTVIRGSQDLYRIQDHEVYLADSVLQAQGQLEKAFLRVWFRERAHPDLQASSLIEESFTDFLYFTMTGDFDLEEAKTKIPIGQDLEPRWPRVLTSWSGYCHSLWRTNEDLRLCEDLKSFSDDEIHLMSLRPLLVNALISSYQNLSASEQVAFLQGFANSLGQMQFHQKNFGITPVQLHQRSYYEAVSQLENWTYFLNGLGSHVPHADKIAALFELELRKRGFDDSNQQSVLDKLVMADELSSVQRKSILEEMNRNKQFLIGLETHGSLQMSLQSEPLNLKLLGPVRAISGVYLHCGTPDLKKIGEMSKKVEKLLFVNFCGTEQVVYLKGYFEKDVWTFAKQNPGLKFAELHLPSLMLALQKMPGQNPIQLLSEKKKESLQPLGWKDPVFDEITNSYRAQSAIEMVDWYRL